MALSASHTNISIYCILFRYVGVRFTLVEHIAERAVVKNHDLTEVRFYRAEILDECSMPERAMLPIISGCKVLPFRLEPVDYRVRVLLHGCGEHYEIEPFGDLGTSTLPP